MLFLYCRSCELYKLFLITYLKTNRRIKIVVTNISLNTYKSTTYYLLRFFFFIVSPVHQICGPRILFCIQSRDIMQWNIFVEMQNIPVYMAFIIVGREVWLDVIQWCIINETNNTIMIIIKKNSQSGEIIFIMLLQLYKICNMYIVSLGDIIRWRFEYHSTV